MTYVEKLTVQYNSRRYGNQDQLILEVVRRADPSAELTGTGTLLSTGDRDMSFDGREFDLSILDELENLNCLYGTDYGESRL